MPVANRGKTYQEQDVVAGSNDHRELREKGYVETVTCERIIPETGERVKLIRMVS